MEALTAWVVQEKAASKMDRMKAVQLERSGKGQAGQVSFFDLYSRHRGRWNWIAQVADYGSLPSCEVHWIGGKVTKRDLAPRRRHRDDRDRDDCEEDYG